MPAAVGHTSVYGPDHWPIGGYMVQAVYDNSHVWNQIATSMSEIAVRDLKLKLKVMHNADSKTNEMIERLSLKC